MIAARRFQPYRRFVRILLVLFIFFIPFVRIKRESAFRFDIPSLSLLVFGSRIAIDQFYLVLISILFLTFLFILVTILFGRIWCGWLCPQTVIADLTRFIDRRGRSGLLRQFVHATVILLLSVLLAADVFWYFVPPHDFAVQISTGRMNAVIGWSWAILSTIVFLNLMFLRRRFCATVCPYAKMQGVLYDEQTLTIAMDPERRDECMGCDACVRTCPVEIDVREGVQTACINCAECIDACADRMGRRSKPSLIGYRFGLHDDAFKFMRKGVLFSAACTILFAAILAYLLAHREKIELMVLPDTRFMPKIVSDGNLVNRYALTITNRADVDTTLGVQATGAQGKLLVIPDQVRIKKYGHGRLMITVKTKDGPRRRNRPENIIISIVSESGREVVAQQNSVMSPPR